MASQSADTGGDRNQDRPLRSPVPSVRGKANRHHPTRVFGPHVVLDHCRSRKQAARFRDVLQQPSHAYLAGRANARDARVTASRKSPLLSMATSLSSPISDTSGCLIFNRLAPSAVSGQPWQDFQLNHSVFEFLIAVRFADPILSLPTGCVSKVRLTSLSQRDYRKIGHRINSPETSSGWLMISKSLSRQRVALGMNADTHWEK